MAENDLIIIDITDREYIKLDVASKLVEIKGDGKLIVQNPSQKSRLWNLALDIKENINTSVPSKDLNPGTINPGQDFFQDYDIQNLKEPILKVVELFDTERNTGDILNNVILYNFKNECNLKLILTNSIDVPIVDIKLIREMPEFLQEIEIKTAPIGKAELKEEGGKRILSWEIDSLAAGDSMALEVESTINIQDKSDQSLGSLKINYLANNKKLTMFDPEIIGLTDSMSGIDRDESSSPGKWDCNVEFINDSEFQVKLEEVKVTQKITTGTETVVSQTPALTINPQGTWDHDFQLEAKDVPELESEIKFTPLFKVIPRIIGEINKESTIYHVLAAEIHKEISPPEVGAYANTDMKIDNTITNTGTASIELLKIFDDIPPDFIPPKLEQITITLKNPEGSIEIQERAEFIKNIDIEPNDQSPDSKHKINIKLHNLEKQLPPNSKLIVSYPLLAKNPKPEEIYKTPVQIKGNTPAKGLYFVISPPEEPEIKIKYIQRKLKTLKSIKPGVTEGDFSISVRIQNKGDVELENIIVKDKIPIGFSLSNFTPPASTTHKVVPLGDESELQVSFPELKAKESITINYDCSGSGDYPRSEPQVIVKGRGDSGSASASTDSTASPEISSASGLSQAKLIEINEMFANIIKKAESGINCMQLGNALDEMVDPLPQGPILHKFTQFIREVKDMNDKMVVGSTRDDIMTKLNDFKGKYL